jgi:hypothetical protein
MRLRLVLLLFAFVLAWSGLGATDASRADGAIAAASALGQTTGGATDADAGPSGHVLPDDRPLQALGDPSSESPAIVPEPLASRPARAAERHADAHRTVAAAPYLDGPERPPRAFAPAA